MDQTVPSQVAKIERKIYTGLPARGMKLLGSGATQAEVSRALGVDESLVSQWMKEDDFREQVNELVKKLIEEQSEIDMNYHSVERQLSERLRGMAQHLFDPDKILRTLKFVNEAKQRSLPGDQKPGDTKIFAPVTLIFPAPLAREFILNPNNEVIGVDGRELVTIDSKTVDTLAKNRKNSINTGDKELKKLGQNGSRQTDPYGDL